MRFFFIWLCWLLLPLAGTAQSFGSLQDVLQYADKNGAAAQQAKLQPQIARQDVNLAASGLYPRVNAFATGDHYPVIPVQVIPAEVLGGVPGTYYQAQFGLPYVFTAGAEFSMPVVNLEKWAQLSRARAQYTQAQWSSQAALEQYHIQLVQAYYQALVTKAVLQLNNDNRKVADELLRIATHRNDAGVLNPTDYNRSRNVQLDVRSTGISYEKSLQQSVNNLNSLLNITGGSVQLTDSLAGFNWPLLQSPGDINNRPGMQEANARMRVAELALSESKRGGLPRLALNGRYGYNMQSKLESGSDHIEFQSASVGLRLDVPLFQGNYYRSLKNKSELQLKSAKLDLQRTTSTLSQQQSDWFNMYTAAYNRQQVLSQKITSATDNLRIAQLNLEEGVMEFDEFNNIFIEYNRARMDYIQNLADGVLYYLLSTQNF